MAARRIPDAPSASEPPSAATRLDLLSNALSASGTLQGVGELLTHTAGAAAGVAGARHGVVGVTAALDGVERYVADDGSAHLAAALGHGPGALSLLAAGSGPCSVPVPAEDPAWRAAGPLPDLVAVPLEVRGEYLGALFALGLRGAAPQSGTTPLSALAASCAVALDNARHRAEAERRRRCQQACDELSAFTGAGPAELLERTAAGARRLCGAQVAAIAVPAPGGDELVVACTDDGGAAAPADGTPTPAIRTALSAVAGRRTPLDAGPAGRVHRSGEQVELAEAATEPLLRGLDLGSAMLLPLSGRRPDRGVLLLGLPAGAGCPAGAAESLAVFTKHAALVLEAAETRADAGRVSVLRDRERIAEELHDAAIRPMSSVAMSLSGTVHRIADPDPARRVQRAVDDLDATIRRTRDAVFAFNGADAGQRSLRGGVLDVIDSATSDATDGAPRVTVGLRFDGPLDAVPDPVVGDVLAVLRDALSGAARHASRAEVSVAVTTEEGSAAQGAAERRRRRGGGHTLQHRIPAAPQQRRWLTVEVVDDWARPAGLVPLPLERSAARLDGACTATPTAGGGTRLVWRVPLPA
ncbi:sensor histidine kinase [Nocardiopsis coralliicola]